MYSEHIIKSLHERAIQKIAEATALGIDPEPFPVEPELISSLIKDVLRLQTDVALLLDGKCAQVIPGSFVACGEEGNFCSEACLLRHDLEDRSAAMKKTEAMLRSLLEYLHLEMDEHNCGRCLGTGKWQDGDDCDRCHGTGKTYEVYRSFQ